MTNPVYNVIWVDDEIDQILEEARESFELQDVRIVGTAKSALELQEKLKILKGKYDAVITDANFSMHLNAPMEERDYSGLMCLLGLLAMYKDIPFFIYTGRPLGSLYEQFKYGELEYFRSQEHVFIKGKDESALIEKIKERVDKCQSLEHIIRNKYRKELEIAENINYTIDEGNSYLKADEKIQNWLVKMEKNEADNVEEWFNPMRQIYESIFGDLKGWGILPNGGKLNHMAGWLSGEIRDGYIIPEPSMIIHPVLAYSLSFGLALTQDGSHNTPNLKYRVVNYVTCRQSIRLFSSLLGILMEILVWYAEIKEKYGKHVLPAPIWEKTTMLDVQEIKDELGRSYLHAGRFQVNPKYFKVGDKVDILEASLQSNDEIKQLGITHFANKFTKVQN